MMKQQFLLSLRERLSALPQDALEERLRFYDEIIEDRMDDGLAEEEAVAAIGSVDDLAAQSIADTPLLKLVKQNLKPKKHLKAWEIVLLVLGSPLWLSLLIAALAVALSLYASLWAVVGSLWAAFGSLIACGIGGVLAGTIFAFQNHVWQGLAVIGGGLTCAGLGILLFFGCKAATDVTVRLAKATVKSIKRCFGRKEVTA